MSQTLRFKRKFKPLTVEIDGKDEAVYKFQTVAITRSVERELAEAIEAANDADVENAPEAIEKVVDMTLEQLDKVLVPAKGKKTKASKVFRELWEADEVESADIIDFLNEIAEKRRPT